MKKRIRIQGTLIFGAVMLFVVFVGFTVPRWADQPTEEFFDMAGIVSVLSGFLLRVVARGYKEETSQGGGNLVTGGPYSLMRNPMYAGTLLIGVGIISILLRLWALPIFVIIYLVIYMPQVDREEAFLLERFGKKYEEYCATTPKYLPRIFGFFRHKKMPLALRWFWFKKEMPSFAWTLAVVFAIEIWQDIKLFGPAAFFNDIFQLLAVLLVFSVVIFILYRTQHKKK